VGEKNLVREDENEESGGWIEEREREREGNGKSSERQYRGGCGYESRRERERTNGRVPRNEERLMYSIMYVGWEREDMM
jgi:hypothetical protein